MKTKLFSVLGVVGVLMNAIYAPTTHASTTAAPSLITQTQTKPTSPNWDCKVSQTTIPVPAGVLTLSVAPATTNPAITDAPDCPHYVALSQTARRQPELFVFLPGTNIEPMQQQMIVNQAAVNGYYALALSYHNLIKLEDACADPAKGFVTDPTCHTNAHEEVLTGAPTSPVITVSVTNSIVSRLSSLISYLDAKYPNAQWGQFLKPGGGIQWNKIRIGGHSQGSGHSSYIATKYEVARACTFAGPSDGVVYGTTPPVAGAYTTMTLGALTYYVVPATWVTSSMATSAQRIYSFAHDDDKPTEPRLLTWGVMGHLNIAGLATVDGAVPPYAGSHALTTTIAVTRPDATPHGSVVMDDDTPLTVSGLPQFAPVWETMCFANHPNPEPDPDNCQNLCRDLGDAPDSNNSLGNPMSIHPFGAIAQPAFYPTEFTGAAGTGPIHLNAGSNVNPNGVPLTAIDSALGLEVNAAGNLVSPVSNERNAFLLPDQDVRKRNIIPAPNPANGRSNRDGYDNAFVGPAGAPLIVKFAACQPAVIQYAQYIHGPWAMNGFYTGTRYINVWADFNRDGDWADNGIGAACPEFPNASVNEWFVRNMPAPNASGVFVLPPQLMPNNFSTRPFWLRISISETPAPAGSVGNGPPNGYRFGETEDHLLCYRQNVGLWGDCPMLQLKLNDELDGEVKVDFNRPVTFTAAIQEEATYPVTVTWTIDGSGVSQIGAEPNLRPSRQEMRLC